MGKTTSGVYKTYSIANMSIDTRLKIKLLAFALRISVSETVAMAINLLWEQNKSKTLGGTFIPPKIEEIHGVIRETRGKYKVKKENK